MGPGIEPFWGSVNVFRPGGPPNGGVPPPSTPDPCTSLADSIGIFADALLPQVLVDRLYEFGVPFALGLVLVLLVPRGERRWGSKLFRGVLCLALVLAIGTGAWSRERRRSIDSRRSLIQDVPRQGMPERGYVSSQTCRSCHPEQFASWHASFHRTMTQVAAANTVLGDFDGLTLHNRGRPHHLSRDRDGFWVDMVDPEWEAERRAAGVFDNDGPDAPRIRKRVVMTTGSHHQQGYWVGSTDDRMLYSLPFMWLVEEGRWAPREDVFMRPPNAGRGFDQWNTNCIECHSVAGESNVDSATGWADTQVAELGIACEACHGPAEEHVRVNSDPLRRIRMRTTAGGDPTIVNPARLDGRRSAQVCGQCHGLNVFKGDVAAAGVRYRPGDDLCDTRMIMQITDAPFNERERADWRRLDRHLDRQKPNRAEFLADRMWPDGMVRVTGREHNMLMASPCRADPAFSCLSCHSMHRSRPDDQLAARMEGDHACLQCHAEYQGERLTAHTRHRAGSPGSACYNCHMPHTTYGLLKAVRSHQISSPSVAASVQTGRPNACNLCHLDRTLEWTQDRLAQWYGAAPVALTEDQRTTSAAVLWALTGDAHQRALIAWHMGWPAARSASGQDWMAPYLGHLLADPYSVVRYIARRSLRTLPGLSGFEYDFLAPPEARSAARERAIEAWQAVHPRRLDRSGPELLLESNGTPMTARLSELARQRDDRRVDLRE